MSKGPVKEAVKSGIRRRLAATQQKTATQQKGAAYQGAMEAVFAILIATGLGYWADEHFGSGPLYLVIGAVVGFSAFVVRLLRLGKQVEEFSEQTGSASGLEDAGEPVATENETENH